MTINQCSIIVCTYNRLEYLKKCLKSLLALDFSEFEIIIINDGSTDNTRNFLDNLQHDKIRAFHHDKNQGLSAARNTGIKNAKYEILVFTDDDCVADKNWLTNLVQGFTDEKIGLVIGQTFYIKQNYKGYFPERLVSNPNAKWPMGNNIAYRQEVFKRCGGFDDFFYKYNNEDSEMAIRAISQGFNFNRAPQAIVFHQPANWTVNSLLNAAINASVWPILKKKYPNHYNTFGPPVKFGFIVNWQEYFYLLFSPVLIPLLLLRYLLHGKRDLKIFFAKWPVCLILKRYYVYKEALRKKVFMI